MEEKWERISHITLVTIHFYLLLPTLIFCLGWCKWYIGIFAACVIIVAAYFSIRQYVIAKVVANPGSVIDKKSVYKFLTAIIVIVLWVILSGIGGYVWQNDDHLYRNAIFNIIVTEDWPVVRQLTINSIAQERGLIYYIGFWLPAGIIGKIFGLQAGYAFQCIWAVLGIGLFYSLICIWRKKVALWPLFIFIFFSGMDIIGTICSKVPITILWGIEHLERWPGIYQYSSITTQLFWVFNQAIPAWLACALLFLKPNSRNCVFVWVSIMFTSILPFIGLLPYVIYLCCTGDKPLKQFRSVRECIKELWHRFGSIPNIVGGGIIGILFFLYFFRNASGNMWQILQKIPMFIWFVIGVVAIGIVLGIMRLTIQGYGKYLKLFSGAIIICGLIFCGVYLLRQGYPIGKIISRLFMLIWFYMMEVGCYLVVLRHDTSRPDLWWLCCISLMIIPLIKIGTSIDFCMRASIPGLMLIYFWCIKRLNKGFKTYRTYALCVILAIGGITSLHEIARTIVNSSQPYNIEAVEEEAIFTQGNFSGEARGIFWEYIAK